MDRWRRVQDLFLEALELDGPGREALLQRAAAEDPGLRLEVAAMLDANRQSGALDIEQRLGGLTGAADSPDSLDESLLAEASVAVGMAIGPYRVAEAIGRGGMAEVYRAERDDDQYRQEVAIKLVRRGLESGEVVRRFRAERQILARLEHPNIARLTDGGIHEDGRPFLVMELVGGLPITEFCESRGLSIAERLRLFLTVCEAVEHAHRNLVVHRDLKPSNILVDERGAVKLLDFGIAKLLDGSSLGVQVAQTRTVVLLMTPEYASPEQVRGEAITTATDVHALGLLLYELLSGKQAFHADARDRASLERVICESDPERVSRAAPAERRRLLQGDLDNIVQQALRKDPAKRYRSVEQFADDLRRHLEGHPVRARGNALSYRLSKFVRRNRYGLAAAGLATLLLTGFALASFFQARAVARERDAARAERDKARQVTELLVDLFDADPFAADEKRMDDLTIRQFLERSEQDVRESLADQPELQATLMGLLGRLYGNLGMFDRARDLSEQAVDARREVYGPDSLRVAESMNVLATVLQHQGDFDTAEEQFRQALAIREARHDGDHLEIAESLNNLSSLLSARERAADFDEIERLEQRVLEMRRKLLGDDHLEVAQSYNNLAVFHYQRAAEGDLEQAETLYRQALRIRGERLGESHPSVGNTANNLAYLLFDLGNFDEAEASFRQAIAAWSASLGEDHPNVSAAQYGLSATLEAGGDLEGAEAALRRSTEIDAGTLAPDHIYVADGKLELGQLLIRKQDFAAARPLLAGAAEIYSAKGAVRAEQLGITQVELGRCLLELGRYAEAEQVALTSYSILEQAIGSDDDRTRSAATGIVRIYEAWGRPERAEPWRDKMLHSG